MAVPFVRLDLGYLKYKAAYDAAALDVLASGHYVLGLHLEEFEKRFAAYIGVDWCVGVNSGLDALELGLRALGIGPGDEVIVPAHTFMATLLAIVKNGARPVLVEPDIYFNLDVKRVEAAISPRTKAILVVHLYGQAADMVPLMTLAQAHGLHLVEDCAQSHGSRVGTTMTGSFGTLGCFSFYPTKGLGAFGDGGAIVGRDPALYKTLKQLRNYGSEEKYEYPLIGTNSRMDELQAALLTVKLLHLDEIIRDRRILADRYLDRIINPLIRLPQVRPGSESVWHLFVIQVEDRNRLMDDLKGHQIQVGIHYPTPPHLAPALKDLGHRQGDFPLTEDLSRRVVSLPLFDGMTLEEQDRVIETLNRHSLQPHE